jgi:ABC-2 type transport system ATP-binding protein
MLAVECKDVSKDFKVKSFRGIGTVRAIQELSLAIEAGRTIGLVGPNGAGKSTLISLIAGLIFPSRGSVLVSGYPARSLNARRSIGYMPESPVFLGLYTARQVLLYHGALSRLSRTDALRRASVLLDRLGLTEAAHRRCYSFSLGMRQRLALGVALMGDPPILLLDEPSNGLDPVGIAELRELLCELSRSGKTMIISSHRLDELEKVTSDFVFLKKGRTVPFGTAAASPQQSLVRVGILAPCQGRIEDLLPSYQVASANDHEILVRVSEARDVATVVAKLVEGGVAVIRVQMEKQTAEQAFLSLCQKGE